MLNSEKNDNSRGTESIARKISDLNEWQENQKRGLQERQNAQRMQLRLEQAALYESLGFSGNVNKNPNPNQNGNHHNDNDNGNENDYDENDVDSPRRSSLNESSAIESNIDEGSIHMGNSSISSKSEVVFEVKALTKSKKTVAAYEKLRSSGKESTTASTGTMDETDGGQSSSQKTTRQFLKRGDGLRQRFKLDPNAYKLDKLPKYKYAGAHPHLRSKDYGKPLKLQKNSTASSNSQAKCQTQSEKGAPIADTNNKDFSQTIGDVQEQHFQKALINSKLACSSTPDLKSSGYASNDPIKEDVRRSKVLEKVQQFELITEEKPQKVVQIANVQEIVSPEKSWAEVRERVKADSVQSFNIETITSTCMKNINQTQEEMDTLNMFEFIEEQVRENNIDVNPTLLAQLWKRSLEKNTEHDEESIGTYKLNDDEKGNEDSAQADSVSDYVTDDDGNNSANDKLREGSPSEAEDTSTYSYISDKNDDRNLDDLSTAGDADRDQYEKSESSENCKDKSNYVLEHFREVLFNLLNQRARQAECDGQDQDASDNITIKVNPETHMVGGEARSVSFESVQLPEELNTVKQRNIELEREVASFKEANKKLTKMKQEFELEKSIFEQERQDALKEMHDIRIKFELYMHDERTKLEEEKRKMEQQIRLQRVTKQNKDRIAVVQLKEEVEKLNNQLRQKEQNHTAAQARLRSQIVKMEKDHKCLLDELEQLKKENKRLENECLRIEREKNNKLLDEINKNIAKLAPKINIIDGPSCSGAGSTGGVAASVGASTSTAPKKVSGKLHGQGQGQGRRIKSPESRKVRPKKLEAPLNTPNEQSSSDEETSAVNVCADKMTSIRPHTLCRATSITGIEPTPPPPPPKADTKDVKTLTASVSTSTEFNREIINPDGSKDIWYSNGNIKKLSANRNHIKMLYFNKDIKETDIEKGTVKYYYASTNTWHTTYLDGLEILEFPNGQTEHRLKSGVVETHFPNHSVKIVDPNNKEVESEWHFEDGTKLKHMHNGDKVLILPNGQREVHTKQSKRREYPDGTVKIVYPDGSQETRYSNGRVRLKDKDGKLIMDSDNAVRY